MRGSIFFKNKYYFYILALVIIVFFIFVFFSYTEKINEEEFFLNRSLKRLNAEVDVILNAYNITADAVYNNILNKKDIKRLIYYGWKFENRRDNYRIYLKKQLTPLYNDLKDYHIRQLHVHFKDGSSFLRMHRPAKYGDNLFKVREGIKYVNTEKKEFVGFEEGRIFNGYRYIYPLSYKGEHIGSVEISLSFEAVTQLLQENLGGAKALIIKNNIVKNKVFAEERSNYKQISFIDNYSYDVEIHQKSVKNNSEVDDNIIRQINRDNKEKIQQKIKTANSFIVFTKVNDNFYTGSFINVKGINGKTKAYMVSYQKNEALNFINHKFKLTIFLSLIFLILTVILLAIIFSSNNRLRYLANNDQLTQISNRRHLTSVLEREYERKKRYDSTFSFIIFDIDHFKEVNDNYGHDVGDSILREMSGLVEKNIRKNDHFGRWGGEEFVIIAAAADIEAAEKFAEKLRKIIEDHNFMDNKNITASFGAAQISENEDINDLIKRADDALYRAKEKGRNRVEVD